MYNSGNRVNTTVNRFQQFLNQPVQQMLPKKGRCFSIFLEMLYGENKKIFDKGVF
jgi:hypothetical protein